MSHEIETARAMTRLEECFACDREAHHLLAILYAAISTQHPDLMHEEYNRRVRHCVEEHIRLSGDVYDRR
jgi:hypothetical protein